MNKEELWFKKDRLFDYANGAYPRLANPWIGVDKVSCGLDGFNYHIFY